MNTGVLFRGAPLGALGDAAFCSARHARMYVLSPVSYPNGEGRVQVNRLTQHRLVVDEKSKRKRLQTEFVQFLDEGFVQLMADMGKEREAREAFSTLVESAGNAASNPFNDLPIFVNRAKCWDADYLALEHEVIQAMTGMVPLDWQDGLTPEQIAKIAPEFPLVDRTHFQSVIGDDLLTPLTRNLIRQHAVNLDASLMLVPFRWASEVTSLDDVFVRVDHPVRFTAMNVRWPKFETSAACLKLWKPNRAAVAEARDRLLAHRSRFGRNSRRDTSDRNRYEALGSESRRGGLTHGTAEPAVSLIPGDCSEAPARIVQQA